MPTCWKCEKELPEGQIECDPPCGNNSPAPTAERAEIDWNKVNTAGDFRLIVVATGLRLHIAKNSDTYNLLNKFLI